MKRILSATFLALLALLTSNASALAETRPIEVVATFSVLGDMVRQVGGNLVHVTTLVGADSDAHTYKPTPRDSRTLASAELIVKNGLGMEGWIARLVSASGFKGKIAVASEGVVPLEMADGGEDAGHLHSHHEKDRAGHIADPHAWQNVANARIYAENIAKALSDMRPGEKQAIAARAKAYDAELEALDAWIISELGDIPPRQRKIITSHDVFGYFGAAYGVVFLAPQGISTEIEPTATEVAKLIGQMKSEKVRRVFFEAMASPRLIKQLAKDSGASVGRPIYSDALSKMDGPASTYVAMIRHNVSLFKEAMALNGK